MVSSFHAGTESLMEPMITGVCAERKKTAAIKPYPVLWHPETANERTEGEKPSFALVPNPPGAFVLSALFKPAVKWMSQEVTKLASSCPQNIFSYQENYIRQSSESLK